MKIMDEVLKGKRSKFNEYNFEDEIFIRGEECNALGFFFFFLKGQILIHT